jgi:hypothetical protein
MRGSKDIWVIALLALATGAFILANALQGGAASWGESDAVAALFGPVLRRAHALYCKVALPACLSQNRNCGIHGVAV